jgi:hypothetical protein
MRWVRSEPRPSGSSLYGNGFLRLTGRRRVRERQDADLLEQRSSVGVELPFNHLAVAHFENIAGLECNAFVRGSDPREIALMRPRDTQADDYKIPACYDLLYFESKIRKGDEHPLYHPALPFGSVDGTRRRIGLSFVVEIKAIVRSTRLLTRELFVQSDIEV